MPAAPITLTEQGQQFAFGATTWQEVEKYDNCAAHVALSSSVQGMQGVDFVGLARGSVQPQTLFFEVKDYRNSRRGMPKHKEVAKELAAKTVGTLAGVSVAARSSQQGLDWRRAAKGACDPGRGLLVVLHVESPDWQSTQECKAELAALTAELDRELRWLPRCTVLACSERAPYVSDCVVTSV